MSENTERGKSESLTMVQRGGLIVMACREPGCDRNGHEPSAWTCDFHPCSPLLILRKDAQ